MGTMLIVSDMHKLAIVPKSSATRWPIKLENTAPKPKHEATMEDRKHEGSDARKKGRAGRDRNVNERKEKKRKEREGKEGKAGTY